MSDIPGHNSYNTNLCAAPLYYQFSVKDRYGAPFDYLVAPEGYEFTGEFRPAADEYALFPRDKHSASWVQRSITQLPVLILRPRPKRKRIIFEEVRRIQRGDFACPGEWFLYDDITHRPGISREATPGPGIVMSRREEEF